MNARASENYMAISRSSFLFFFFFRKIRYTVHLQGVEDYVLLHAWVFTVHQKVSRYIGDAFFLGPNLVSFNRAVVPYEISKVNFRVGTTILVSMSEEI